MKFFTVAAHVLFLSLLPARADLTLVQKVEGAGPVNTMRMKIKNKKVRIDATPQVATIIDSASGEILNLMNEQKKFMRVSATQAKAAAELAMKGDDNATPPSKPELKPTGKKETIQGYETEEYICEVPAFKATYWIAAKYPNAAAIIKELATMTPQSWGVAGKGMPDYRDFPGVPLRSRVSVGGKEITSTVVSIKQDPLPVSEFVPPPGFEEMKMPDMDAMFGGAPPASKTAPASKR